MIESAIKAEKECTEEEDIEPDKVLRPIGTVFRVWIEPQWSTELPHWAYWEVVRYITSYCGRKGNILLYERHEEIRGIEKPVDYETN